MSALGPCTLPVLHFATDWVVGILDVFGVHSTPFDDPDHVLLSQGRRHCRRILQSGRMSRG